MMSPCTLLFSFTLLGKLLTLSLCHIICETEIMTTVLAAQVSLCGMWDGDVTPLKDPEP